MSALTLRNVPDDLHEKLKRRAGVNGRSLNAEAIACLRAAIGPEKVDVAALLVRARESRGRVKGRVTDRLLAELTEAGRP